MILSNKFIGASAARLNLVPLTDFEAKSPAAIRGTRVDRYRLGPQLAKGETGTLHVGILTGSAQFSRIVAIKRLHPWLVRDRVAVERFRNVARTNARVLDEHVVQLLDFVESEGEIWQVLEYVDGDTLHALAAATTAAGRQLPLDVSVAIVVAALHGLHGAHEASHESGLPLRLVHQAVAPQNIMLARSGHVKVINFGSARSTFRKNSLPVARAGQVKYLSPEQVRGEPVDRRADVFSAGVVLWEALTGRGLFAEGGGRDATILENIEHLPIAAPSAFRPEISMALDAVVLRALERKSSRRFNSALEFARALEATLTPASESRIGAYLTVYCEPRLAHRERLLQSAENRADSRPARDTLPNAFAVAEDDEVTRIFGSEPPDSGRPSDLPRESLVRPLRPGRRVRARAALIAGAALMALTCLGWRMRAKPVRSPEPSAPTLARAAPGTRVVPIPSAKATASAGNHDFAPRQSLDAPEVSAHAVTDLPLEAPKSSTETGARRPGALATRTGAQRSGEQRKVQSRPSSDCAVATYLGADGIRHFKEACL